MASDDEISISVVGPEAADLLDHVADDVFDDPIDPRHRAAFFAAPNHILVVATAGGQVVAMASGVLYHHPDKAAQLWVNEVGTGVKWRRRGLGRRVTEALLAEGWRRGASEAWLATEADNDAARGLYRDLRGAEDPAVVYSWTAPVKRR